MAASLQLSARPFKPHFQSKSLSKPSSIRLATIRCSAATPPKRYSITLLPGDGIGPEVISVAKNVLKLAGSLEGISCLFLNTTHLILLAFSFTTFFFSIWFPGKRWKIRQKVALRSIEWECVPYTNLVRFSSLLLLSFGRLPRKRKKIQRRSFYSDGMFLKNPNFIFFSLPYDWWEKWRKWKEKFVLRWIEWFFLLFFNTSLYSLFLCLIFFFNGAI